MLLTAGFMLAGLLAMGGALLIIGRETTRRMFDDALLAAADQAARGPNPLGRMGPQGGPPGGPPPGDDPQRMERRGGGMGRVSDPERGPRFIGLDGRGAGPPDAPGPWSQALFEASVRGERRLATVALPGRRVRVASVPVRRREGVAGVVQIAESLERLEFAQSSQTASLLFAAPVALLAAAMISAVLARQILRPIAGVTEVAERIAEEPDSGDRLPERGEDEMARLAVAFNRMTGALQESNHRLRESLDSQRRFSADASHELRTPLTRITLAVQNGLDARATPDEARSALQVVERASAAMVRLVDRLLILTRADAARAALSIEPLDLRGPLADAVLMTGLGEDPRLRMDLPDTPVMVAGNADAIRQIATNLLENAARYAASAIVLRASTEGVVEVLDDGPGIDPERLPKVFERFYRADPARTGGERLGLGLAIVKALAESMSAEAGAANRAEGGAAFFIRFSTKDRS